MDVNYRAAIAAAKACETLGFGHFVQASTQATNAERAGQVPYSKAKAMADFALSRLESLPISIACLGMLYVTHFVTHSFYTPYFHKCYHSFIDRLHNLLYTLYLMCVPPPTDTAGTAASDRTAPRA